MFDAENNLSLEQDRSVKLERNKDRVIAQGNDSFAYELGS